MRKTIHQCELLEYESRYLDLAFPDTEYQRWTLRWAKQGTPNPEGDDTVFMQVLAFCPCCGMDLRKDLDWRIAGKPKMNEILERIQASAS